MTEEFNIFKNLDDLRKTNLLDKIKSLESAKTEDLDNSQDLEDFDFDDSLVNTNNNNNVKKSPTKRQRNKEKPVTPEKKSKKNGKSRRSSSSTDCSISPTLPLLEHLSQKVNEMPVGRRTRRSLGACKETAENETILENMKASSSKGRGRGKGRGGGRGRGRGRGKEKNDSNPNNSIDLCENSFGLATHNSSNEISAPDEESDTESSTLSIMERFLQQGRRGRSRVMRARRQYIAEIAARSTQIDSIDLVSSPLPRVEGFIDLDSDTEETTRTTRSKQKNQDKIVNNAREIKVSDQNVLNMSFDEDNPEMNIKVNWKGKPEAFKLRKYQKFSIIFKKLAERENITEDSIVFNLKDRIILPDDTPESINYKIFQFIDGRVLTNRFNSPGVVAAAAANKKRDANKITLKIQSDKWKRPLQIDLMKTDKFRILYIKCAEELKVAIDHLKLSFDGESLELNDTPADLDLEGGEAIDLRIKN